MSKNMADLVGLNLLIIVIGGACALRIIQIKYVKKAIEQEKYDYGAYYRMHPVYGEKAIKTARLTLILVDIIFWLVPITMVIIELHQFIVYGRLI
jgi:hypothetical protein